MGSPAAALNPNWRGGRSIASNGYVLIKVGKDHPLADVRGYAYEHRVEHRKHDHGLRMPGEPNPTVQCKCGCGEQLERYDNSGRPRSYISGHNPPEAPTTTAIREYLSEHGPTSRTAIALALAKSVQSIATALSKMKRAGLVHQIGRGEWASNV